MEIYPNLYKFHPSIGLAIAFLVIFLICSLILSLQMWRYKIKFLIPFLIGDIMEVVGFVGRIVNCNETPDWTLGPYIVQALFLLLPPAFYAASIYMSLGRLVIAMHREDLSIIKPKIMTLIFVLGDVFAFLAQSTGGGMQAKEDPDSQKAGQWIVVGGLIVQLIYFGFFIIVAFNYQIRVNKAAVSDDVKSRVNWKLNLIVLYAASFLILIRSIYRVVEYVTGKDGTIMTHEWFFYVFDAALMAMVAVIYAVVPPKELTRANREAGYQDMELTKLEAGSRSDESPK